MSFRDAGWDVIEQLRADGVEARPSTPSVAAAAQRFTQAFAAAFSTVALARMFVVAPLRLLPVAERAWAERFAHSVGRPLPLHAETPVLCLLGSSGLEPAWNQRETSLGHRAIPLVDRALIEGAPMIAELLAALKVDIAGSGGGTAVQLRSMPGGLNHRFYVPDARATRDGHGRPIIAASEFVTRYAIRTVFGMGGTYIDGVMAIAIMFTTELLDAAVIDRYSSFIGTFKIATAELVASHALFAAR